MLQADSKEMYDYWVAALQKGIGAAIQRVQSVDMDHYKKNDNNFCKHSESGALRNLNGAANKDNNNRVKKPK